jgi:hypothetical protein
MRQWLPIIPSSWKPRYLDKWNRLVALWITEGVDLVVNPVGRGVAGPFSHLRPLQRGTSVYPWELQIPVHRERRGAPGLKA